VGEEALGRGLGKIHAAGAPEFGATPVLGGGYASAPMRFNQLSLSNEPRESWAEFYAENRLVPMARLAFEQGAFSAEDLALIERVATKLPEIAGPAEPPARTHGDLWSGNILPASDGRPHLIDPVAHGGHREVDLALLTVFGGPGQRCFDAYDEVFPRAAGHEEREQLWQLAMILLHVLLFGGSYVAQARGIAKRYA
jgi:fructosamine-3-kinase